MSSMYVFTPKRRCLICRVLLTVQNTHRAGALIHQQQTIHWIFTQTKLSSIYRHKPIVLGLEETSSVAYNLGETQTSETCKYFFYFSVAKTAEILATVW